MVSLSRFDYKIVYTDMACENEGVKDVPSQNMPNFILVISS